MEDPELHSYRIPLKKHYQPQKSQVRPVGATDASCEQVLRLMPKHFGEYG